MVEVTKELAAARRIVATFYQGIRDHDYAGWVLNGEKDADPKVIVALAAIKETTAASEARIAELEGEVARLRTLVGIALIGQGKALGELWRESAHQALTKGPTDAK